MAYAARYAEKLSELAEKEKREGRKRELRQMADICRRVPAGAPRTFWEALQQHHPFTPGSALFIDDSLPVLRAADHYGIGHLASILHPDSSQPARTSTDPYPGIDRWQDVLPT